MTSPEQPNASYEFSPDDSQFLSEIETEMSEAKLFGSIHDFRELNSTRMNAIVDYLAETPDTAAGDKKVRKAAQKHRLTQLREIESLQIRLGNAFNECVKNVLEEEEDQDEHIAVITGLFLDVDRSQQDFAAHTKLKEDISPYEVDILVEGITESYVALRDDLDKFRKLIVIRFRKEFTDELADILDLFDMD